jgi:hypothetical protein
MVLHHPIIKARKGGGKRVDGRNGVLETDFPMSSKENLTVIAEDTLEMSIADCSDLSLNQYLSMMSDQEASATYIDDVDIQSIENGTAYPKATSSVLHASPMPSPISKNFNGSMGRPRSSADNSQMSRKATELFLTESHLQRWAKMLEEKEQELAHKEKRLHLWETQIREMLKQSGPLNQSNSSSRNSYAQPHLTNESSGVETDMDSTISAYPGDSVLEPTTVRMDPSKITNPFTRYQAGRQVRFQRSDDDSQARSEVASKMFAEQRLHWLEMKRKKHHVAQSSSPPPPLPPKMSGPPKLETDYIFMEEKSIPIAATKTRTGKSSEPRNKFEMPSHLLKANKENHGGSLRYDPSTKGPPLPTRPTSIKNNDSKILSNELRAKLKSHNLPGLR